MHLSDDVLKVQQAGVRPCSRQPTHTFSVENGFCLPRGPEVGLKECHRSLRPGGRLVFTDPLNWQKAWLWAEYRKSGTIRALLETYGFEIETRIDDLAYRVILEARGSFEKLKTLVVTARKRD